MVKLTPMICEIVFKETVRGDCRGSVESSFQDMTLSVFAKKKLQEVRRWGGEGVAERL
jgi:hypothetical protein